jgi:hypothetical protein
LVHRSVALLVALGSLLIAADASAQEWVGTEVSAAVPGVVMGSNAARLARFDGRLEVYERGAAYAVCDSSEHQYCRGLTMPVISMNTMPNIQLRIPLPNQLSIQGHLWSMLLEDPHYTVRQAMVGPTLRRSGANHWYELGVGMAEHGEAHEVGAPADPHPVAAAALGGAGYWKDLGDDIEFDVRLRGGIAFDDDGMSPAVYHLNLVAAIVWQ